MDVRDAVEADAERLAELTGAPADVMRNLVHDRTVRVAEREAGEGDESGGDVTDPGGNEADGTSAVAGFVSFDARRETVHVTQLEGEREARERLLEEPVRFARGERMGVELLAVVDDEDLRSVLESAGFAEEGRGPRFEGTPTVRYRLDPREA